MKLYQNEKNCILKKWCHRYFNFVYNSILYIRESFIPSCPTRIFLHNCCRAQEITREQMKSRTEQVSDIGSVSKNAVSKKIQERGKICNKYDQHHKAHSFIYCGRQHSRKKCPAYGKVCRNCNKKNHWSKCSEVRKEIKEIATEDDDTYVIETVDCNNAKQCNTKASSSAFTIRLDRTTQNIIVLAPLTFNKTPSW